MSCRDLGSGRVQIRGRVYCHGDSLGQRGHALLMIDYLPLDRSTSVVTQRSLVIVPGD
jgi:hypothetical protein